MAKEILTLEKISNDLKAEIKLARFHLIISAIAYLSISSIFIIIACLFLTNNSQEIILIVLAVIFIFLSSIIIFDLIRYIILYLKNKKLIKINKYSVTKEKLINYDRILFKGLLRNSLRRYYTHTGRKHKYNHILEFESKKQFYMSFRDPDSIRYAAMFEDFYTVTLGNNKKEIFYIYPAKIYDYE